MAPSSDQRMHCSYESSAAACVAVVAYLADLNFSLTSQDIGWEERLIQLTQSFTADVKCQ